MRTFNKIQNLNKKRFFKANQFKNLGLETDTVDSSKTPPTLNIAIYGPTGSFSNNLIPRICKGEMFGSNQKVSLKLIDETSKLNLLEQTKSQIINRNFQYLEKIIITTDIEEGFKDSDYCLLFGGKPRQQGDERKDYILENAKTFVNLANVLNRTVRSGCKVLVVANPANTNSMILSELVKNIDHRAITGFSRIHQDRGIEMIAQKAGCSIHDIDRFSIWGNNSPTLTCDLNNVTINGVNIRQVIHDDNWYQTFLHDLRMRGAKFIMENGKPDFDQQAKSVINHVKNMRDGSDKFQTMIVKSNGMYNIPKELWSSFPVITRDNNYKIVEKIQLSPQIEKEILLTIKELNDEREMVKQLLPNKIYFDNKVEEAPKSSKMKIILTLLVIIFLVWKFIALLLQEMLR